MAASISSITQESFNRRFEADPKEARTYLRLRLGKLAKAKRRELKDAHFAAEWDRLKKQYYRKHMQELD